MTQYVAFQMHLIAVDHPTDRRAWDGGLFPSHDAHKALEAAVAAFEQAVTGAGFDIVRTGYGVLAREDPTYTIWPPGHMPGDQSP